jgi:hypothetical protein
MFCRDHANAEREYFQAGYRPALVAPLAIDFSEVKLTDREKKAVDKARGIRRERADDRDRLAFRHPDDRSPDLPREGYEIDRLDALHFRLRVPAWTGAFRNRYQRSAR